MKNLFSSHGKLAMGVAVSVTGAIFNNVKAHATQTGGRLVDESTVGAALAMESFDAGKQSNLNTAVQSLEAVLRSAVTSAGLKGGLFNPGKASALDGGTTVTLAMESAALAAGVMASAPRAYLRARAINAQTLRNQFGSDETVEVVGHEGIAGAMDARPGFEGRTATEAYDETANTSAVAYAVSYNLQAPRQDEFGEAFFPTVTVTPDNVGFSVSVRVNYLQNEVRRAVTGAASNFGRVNVLATVTDPTLLRNDQTRIIPVVRVGGATDSTASFVASTDVAPVAVLQDGATLNTAPLKISSKVELLGVGQTDAMLAAGQLDQTDSIDSSVVLTAIYIKLGAAGGSAVLKFDTSRSEQSHFNQAIQGNTRELRLAATLDGLRVVATTTKVDGSAPPTQFAAIAANTVRLSVPLFGSVVQDTGVTVVNAANLEVSSVTGTDGVQLALGSGTGATIAALFAGAVVIGYDLQAYRTNSNRRQRGQLVDTQYLNRLYTVPYLPPITALRPINASEANDPAVIDGLLQLTRQRTSQSAIAELLGSRDTLRSYYNPTDTIITQPAVYGVARHLVKAVYLSAAIDAQADLNSLTSDDRPEALTGLLYNVIRDMAYNLHTKSAYKAAMAAMNGGVEGKPLLLIGADPIIARYLTLMGDTRLAGEGFDVRIVSTLDPRMAGKIFLTLGTEQAYGSGAPHPLHYGAMAWSPEVPLMMPMTRNGAISYELTVSPRFRHITNLPILGEITVSNVTAAMSTKIAVDTNQV